MTLKEASETIINCISKIYSPDEAKNIARICLEKTTGLNYSKQILHQTQSLSSEQEKSIICISNDLSLSKPIQYVLNEAWFYGLDFYVDESVLIPRPETEELVQLILDNIPDKSVTIEILDICTGSGCIAIALKKNLPNAIITAIDISQNALATAQKNAKKHKVKIELKEFNVLKENDLKDNYDIVVSNPPYVRNLEKTEMHKNVLDFEPEIALFVPDENPLIFYEKISFLAKDALNNSGFLFFEINQYLSEETKKVLQKNEFHNTLILKDLKENPRFTISTKD